MNVTAFGLYSRYIKIDVWQKWKLPAVSCNIVYNKDIIDKKRKKYLIEYFTTKFKNELHELLILENIFRYIKNFANPFHLLPEFQYWPLQPLQFHIHILLIYYLLISVEFKFRLFSVIFRRQAFSAFNSKLFLVRYQYCNNAFIYKWYRLENFKLVGILRK